MFYIAMLVFQLVGALILLFNTVNGSKKKVIDNCFPGSNVVSRDDNNNVVIPKEQLQLSAKKIYLNIVAFADLLIGYLIAAFSPVALEKKWMTVIYVIVSSIILAVVEYCLVKLFAKVMYAKDEMVAYKELEKIGVDTVITNKEIDQLFKESNMN